MKNCTYIHTPVSTDVLSAIRGEITNYIGGKRLEHTLGVEKTATELAKVIFSQQGIDSKYLNDVSAAALLHDITKQQSDEKQKELCEKHGIDTEKYFSEGKPSAVLHSKTGAYFAKELFDINDVIFASIYNHSTGRENMSIIEKIIFISDYIEPTRTYESCISLRKYVYSAMENNEDLALTIDKAIIISIDDTLKHLSERNATVDSATLNTRNYILKTLNSQSEND